jgi:predicted RNase H-like HicB family nuclease
MGRRWKQYAAVVERASDRNWSAFVPEVPGCVSTGPTAEDTLANVREALAFHLRGQAEDGIGAPEPSAVVGYAEVEVGATTAAR